MRRNADIEDSKSIAGYNRGYSDAKQELISEFLQFLEFGAGELEGFPTLVVFNKKEYEKELEKWEKKLKEKE